MTQSGHPLASQPSYDCILPSGERGIVMKRSATGVDAVVALSISTLATSAEPKAGVDKLYILNCGEGVAKSSFPAPSLVTNINMKSVHVRANC